MQINLTVCLDVSDRKIQSTYKECNAPHDDKSHIHNEASIAASSIVTNVLKDLFKDNPDVRLIGVFGDNNTATGSGG
jgi:hypothetical protein